VHEMERISVAYEKGLIRKPLYKTCIQALEHKLADLTGGNSLRPKTVEPLQSFSKMPDMKRSSQASSTSLAVDSDRPVVLKLDDKNSLRALDSPSFDFSVSPPSEGLLLSPSDSQTLPSAMPHDLHDGSGRHSAPAYVDRSGTPHNNESECEVVGHVRSDSTSSTSTATSTTAIVNDSVENSGTGPETRTHTVNSRRSAEQLKLSELARLYTSERRKNAELTSRLEITEQKIKTWQDETEKRHVYQLNALRKSYDDELAHCEHNFVSLRSLSQTLQSQASCPSCYQIIEALSRRLHEININRSPYSDLSLPFSNAVYRRHTISTNKF